MTCTATRVVLRLYLSLPSPIGICFQKEIDTIKMFEETLLIGLKGTTFNQIYTQTSPNYDIIACLHVHLGQIRKRIRIIKL